MRTKYIKIIKDEKEFLVLDRAGYFIYVLDRIINLRKFNYYFNKTKKRFVIKIFLIVGFIFLAVVLMHHLSTTK